MRRSHDNGFTLIELLIVVAIIGIIAAIAIPGLLRARMSGNEAAAIGSMRSVMSAQQAYASSCANGYYASVLPILGSIPSNGTPFISPDLSTAATVVKSGYQIEMAAGSEATASTDDGCNPLGVAADLYTSYVITAYPQAGNVTGSRWFFANILGSIFQDSGTFASTIGNVKPPTGTPIQ